MPASTVWSSRCDFPKMHRGRGKDPVFLHINGEKKACFPFFERITLNMVGKVCYNANI